MTGQTSLEHDVDAMFAGTPRDMYPTLRRLLAEAPVYPYGDSVIVSKHEDLTTVYRDHHRFPQGDVWGPAAPELLAQLSPEEQELWDDFRHFTHSFVSRKNGVDHVRVRGAVHRYFTPRRVEEIQVKIQDFVDESLADANGVDVIDAYELAYRVPLLVIMEMLGVSRDNADTVRHFGDRLLPRPPSPENVRSAHRELTEYRAWGHALIARHRADPAHTAVVSALLDASGGEKMTEDELVGFFMHTLMAGHETTAGQILNGIRDLMMHRDQWNLLCAEPSAISTAVEEILRYDTPVPYIANKVAGVDVEIRGIEIPAGTQLLLGHASANRDPDAFDDPDRFDITRRPNNHLTLGAGVHFCLGASFARAELQSVFATLARRYPDMGLAIDAGDVPLGGGLRRMKSLPIRLGRPAE